LKPLVPGQSKDVLHRLMGFAPRHEPVATGSRIAAGDSMYLAGGLDVFTRQREGFLAG
jgi:hypothetical protein